MEAKKKSDFEHPSKEKEKEENKRKTKTNPPFRRLTCLGMVDNCAKPTLNICFEKKEVFDVSWKSQFCKVRPFARLQLWVPNVVNMWSRHAVVMWSRHVVAMWAKRGLQNCFMLSPFCLDKGPPGRQYWRNNSLVFVSSQREKPSHAYDESTCRYHAEIFEANCLCESVTTQSVADFGHR